MGTRRIAPRPEPRPGPRLKEGELAVLDMTNGFLGARVLFLARLFKTCR
jgi:hypothetical protein